MLDYNYHCCCMIVVLLGFLRHYTRCLEIFPVSFIELPEYFAVKSKINNLRYDF